MANRNSFRGSGKLMVLFVLAAGIPFAALGWLGYRLLQQDRAIEEQRLRGRIESAAALAAHEIDNGLNEWERLLSARAQGSDVAVPSDGVLILWNSDGVFRAEGVRLPYYPQVASLPEPSNSVFSTAESLEFRDRDLGKAADRYRSLARSESGQQRAEALMRLARCLRGQEKIGAALAVYEDLAALGATPVAGSPAELLARREQILLSRSIGDARSVERDSAMLDAALWQGHVPIDRATFEFYKEALERGPTRTSAALSLAEAAEEVWPVWQQQTSGRAILPERDRALVTVWRETGGGKAALIAGVDALVARALPTLSNLRILMAIEDPAGRVVWGNTPKNTPHILKTARETGLPFNVKVGAGDAPALEIAAASRRNLLAAGFGLTLLVVAAASFFVSRSVNRELRVAILQSEFVAAVSHEFRTPLTAMCHLTEILEEGGTPAGVLPKYYGALAKESRRLHRLVESLLDFARIESGRRTFCMEVLDAAALVPQILCEFREQAGANAHTFDLDTAPGEHFIRADREGITRALWNLLDNAVKYSPAGATIAVKLEPLDGQIGISVEDQGAGIPDKERQEIFHKFVRGTSARNLNVKGTGIGLAMVDRIVQEHRGRIRVESQPGRGSRFTILLPKGHEQT